MFCFSSSETKENIAFFFAGEEKCTLRHAKSVPPTYGRHQHLIPRCGTVIQPQWEEVPLSGGRRQRKRVDHSAL